MYMLKTNQFWYLRIQIFEVQTCAFSLLKPFLKFLIGFAAKFLKKYIFFCLFFFKIKSFLRKNLLLKNFKKKDSKYKNLIKNDWYLNWLSQDLSQNE